MRKAQRFIEQALVTETDDCILWPFGLTNGYGAAYWQGKSDRAHRVICERAHGLPATLDLEATHSCGVKACVNKRHLRWKTRTGNMEDAILHGTTTRGEKHAMGKLTVKAVKEIRRY